MDAAPSYFPRLSLSVSGGGGGGDEPPRYQPWRVKSAHELDEAGFIDPLQTCFECAICGSSFRTPKACRRHLVRSHKGGLRPGAPLPPKPLVLRHVCKRCGKRFVTLRALAGHRSNHKGKLGCAWLSKGKQPAMAARARAPPATATAGTSAAATASTTATTVVVRDFDLNELPAPEEEEELQEKQQEKDPAAPAAN